jgi:hypothetical protein
MGLLSLQKPYRRFARESAWLLETFEKSMDELRVQPRPKDSVRLGAEMTIIRLHDAWARFCRELIVLSAGGRPITMSGTRLPYAPGISCCSNVIPKLLTTYIKPRKAGDLKWAMPDQAIDMAKRLRVANYATISAALAAVGSPIEELRLVRNFYAHRLKDTADKLRTHSSYGPGRVLELESVAADFVPGGISRMESWIISLKLVAEASIQ